ncbi:MAG: hypothetical protein ABI548_29585 [Polyangiaceae bacterium]
MRLEIAAVEVESSSQASVGRYRWAVCALLFFATTINYVDRPILSLLKPILDGEFHWTNAQFGQVNAAFQAAYALGLLGFGAFGWRLHRRLRSLTVNLGYRDYRSIDPRAWEGREDEGLLLVPKAGETLFRLKNDPFQAPAADRARGPDGRVLLA